MFNASLLLLLLFVAVVVFLLVLLLLFGYSGVNSVVVVAFAIL